MRITKDAKGNVLKVDMITAPHESGVACARGSDGVSLAHPEVDAVNKKPEEAVAESVEIKVIEQTDAAEEGAGS